MAMAMVSLVWRREATVAVACSCAAAAACWRAIAVASSPPLSPSRTQEREEREGQHGMVNASVAWSNPLHVGQNSLVRIQLLKVNGFDSWGTGIRRFCS